MRLSEKGIETIFSALLKTIEERDFAFGQISQGVFKKHIEALNFEPDNFDDCFQNGKDHLVCLTVEEANIFLKMTHLIKEIAQNMNHRRVKSATELESKLIDKIAKAEKCDE